LAAEEKEKEQDEESERQHCRTSFRGRKVKRGLGNEVNDPNGGEWAVEQGGRMPRATAEHSDVPDFNWLEVKEISEADRIGWYASSLGSSCLKY
jgi:hypothetical protein